MTTEGGVMFYAFDPTPGLTDEGLPVLCGGYPHATLYGPFPSRAAAESFANVSHPDDMDGSAVVLAALKEYEALVKAADPSVTKDGET